MRKSIYIAYTGGTIGMKPSAQGYIPVANFLTETLQSMPEFHHEDMPTYYIHEYKELIDSSDMHPTHWQQIAQDIAINYDKYDGFVILHGTDTMAYTASALSFMLENLTKPVIITGSQIPLSELRSDGRTNLLNALYLAANYPIAEVSIFFQNRLLRGNRTRKINADGFEAFYSPNYLPLLKAGIHITLEAGKVETKPFEPLQVCPLYPQPIGLISLYPGISSEIIKNCIQQPVKALILLSYGVGNAPQNPEFIAPLQEAIKQGIIILNCTQCLSGKVNMSGYATGNRLQEIGVISGGDMTPEAALTKLHYLFSKNYPLETIKQKLVENLRGELTL